MDYSIKGMTNTHQIRHTCLAFVVSSVTSGGQCSNLSILLYIHLWSRRSMCYQPIGVEDEYDRWDATLDYRIAFSPHEGGRDHHYRIPLRLNLKRQFLLKYILLPILHSLCEDTTFQLFGNVYHDNII